MATTINDIEVKLTDGPNRWDTVLESLVNGKHFSFTATFSLMRKRDKNRRNQLHYCETIKGRVLALHPNKVRFNHELEHLEYLDDWFILILCTNSFKQEIQKRFLAWWEVKIDFLKDHHLFFAGEYDTHTRKGEGKLILPGSDIFFLPSHIQSVFNI